MSSDKNSGDELYLATLVACHHRGAMRPGQLGTLLSADTCNLPIERLVGDGYLNMRGELVAVTQKGRDYLDGVLEEIQGHLTPDSADYERRFRREDAALPFAANTIWAEAFCINIRVRPEVLRPLIPSVFELDLYEGMAFVSLTVSRLKDFGAGNIPKFMRMNFYQSTYRAHVTFTDFRGKRMQGCYFTRSETNSPLMSMTANMLPEFKAHRCGTHPIFMARDGDKLVLTVDTGDDPAGKVVMILDRSQQLSQMPSRSVFRSVKDANDLIVDFYDAFSFEPETNEVYLLGIERGDWNIEIYDPVDSYLGYIEEGPFPPGTAELDSVFYFQDVPYIWLPLVKERVKVDK